MDKIESARLLESKETELDRLTWLTTSEAAFYLRKTAHALRQMVYKGLVRPRKLGGRLFFRRIELERLLESSAFLGG